MVSPIRLREADDAHSLTFDCGALPTDRAVSGAGHEPNGYFWEGVLRYLDAALAETVELDSEAGMFCAYGEATDLRRVRDLLEPYLSDPATMERLVARADAEGFDLDD